MNNLLQQILNLCKDKTQSTKDRRKQLRPLQRQFEYDIQEHPNNLLEDAISLSLALAKSTDAIGRRVVYILLRILNDLPFQINEYNIEVYTKAERKERNQLLYKYVWDILTLLEGDKTKIRTRFRAEALRLLADLVWFYKEKGLKQKLKPYLAKKNTDERFFALEVVENMPR
ncbi:MAG: hypothetical protein ACPG49_09720 [Chitinophagales bacterium]